jgi:hypothetical protein
MRNKYEELSLLEASFCSSFLIHLSKEKHKTSCPKISAENSQQPWFYITLCSLVDKQLAVLNTAGKVVECFKRPQNAHSSKQWIITTITVIPLMAIIININLSSAGPECCSVAQGSL